MRIILPCLFKLVKGSFSNHEVHKLVVVFLKTIINETPVHYCTDISDYCLLFQLQGQTNAEGSAILVLDHTAGELYNKVRKSIC